MIKKFGPTLVSTCFKAVFVNFSVYITWLYLVTMYILPFTLLAILNLRIYYQIRRSQRERQVLTKQERRELNMAAMVLKRFYRHQL